MTNNQNGFTLIEFLVAILILMVGMLGLLQSINVAMDKNLENLFRNEAIMVADEQMMQLRSRSFQSISTTASTVTVVPRNIRGIQKNYSAQRIVTDPTTQSKQIQINVTWRKKNTPYSHSLSSVVTTF